MYKPQKTSNWRIKIIHYIFYLLLILIIIFLARWQIFESERYSTLAKQRVKDTQLSSLRGSILATDGSTLAYSVPVYDVYVYTKDLEDAEEYERQTRDEFLDKVVEILLVDREELENKINSRVVYNIVKRNVSVEDKQKLENLKTGKNENIRLSGLHFEASEKRVYPDKSLAAHVIGFLGKNTIGDDIGRNGVEAGWNGDLAWKSGYIFEEIDSFGNQILTGTYEPIFPKVGKKVELTIDRGLQQVVERKIKEGVERWEAVSGSVIVMDPKTGEILAMANYPTYDPNEYNKVQDMGVFRNRTVSDPYEFGSVGKIFTASAAIDSGKIEPSTIILTSHEGCIHVLDEKEICTASKKPVNMQMDIADILAYSDNIGAFLTAEKVGSLDLYKYLVDFGFGYKTNVGLGDETTSVLKDGNIWNRADLAAYSYGQGYSGTALQIISGASAIPNGGKRMQPYIVSSVYDNEDDKPTSQRVVSTPLKPESALMMNAILTEVFDRNGSKYEFKELNNYKLAGKSGTASVLADNGLGYAEDKVNVSFIGWDSSEYATFIMIIKLEQPKGAPFSVTSVQPLWMETFLEIRDIIGIVPIS